MGDGSIIKEVESRNEEIEEYNRRVASKLSLLPNSPDRNGRNKVDLAGQDLERTRPLWEKEEIKAEVGGKVLIKPGTPVGLGSKGYITGKQVEGTYKGPIDYGLVGGAGYMQHGVRRISPYVQIEAELPPGEETGEENGHIIERVNLRVPRSIFDPVPQVSADGLPIAA